MFAYLPMYKVTIQQHECIFTKWQVYNTVTLAYIPYVTKLQLSNIPKVASLPFAFTHSPKCDKLTIW